MVFFKYKIGGMVPKLHRYISVSIPNPPGYQQSWVDLFNMASGTDDSMPWNNYGIDVVFLDSYAHK